MWGSQIHIDGYCVHRDLLQKFALHSVVNKFNYSRGAGTISREVLVHRCLNAVQLSAKGASICPGHLG